MRKWSEQQRPSARTMRRRQEVLTRLPRQEANLAVQALKVELLRARAELREWQTRARRAELELDRAKGRPE